MLSKSLPKELAYWVVGSFIVAFVFFRCFCGVGFFGGADLGLSLMYPKDYLEVISHSWNYLGELGYPLSNLAEIPPFQVYSLMESVFGNMGVYFFFSAVPWLSSFVLVYIGLKRFDKKPFARFLSALVYVLGPTMAQKYLSVPLVSIYATMLLGAIVIYSICEILPSGLSPRRLLPFILFFPFYSAAFLNPYFAIGALLPLLLLSSWLVISIVLDRVNAKSKGNPCKTIVKALTVTSIFFIFLAIYHAVPLLTSAYGENLLGRLSSNTEYVIGYVRGESSAIPFYASFLNVTVVSADYYVRIALSLIILLIAFYPMTRRRESRFGKFYLVFVSFYIVSIFLEKGAKEPFAFINEALYRLCVPYSFGFRSPFQKFGISSIVFLTLMFFEGITSITHQATHAIKRIHVSRVVTLLVFTLLLVYLFCDPVISGKIIREYSMAKNRNYIEPHLRELRTLLKDGDSRVVLFPLSYGVWSDYELDENSSNGFEYEGTNEYLVLKKPILTQYSWGRNDFLNKLLSEMKYATLDPEDAKELLRFGNVKYIVFDTDKFDHYGVFRYEEQSALVENLRKALGDELKVCNITSTSFKAYEFADETSYLYAVDENSSMKIVDAIDNISKSQAKVGYVTLKEEQVRTCENGSIGIQLDSDGYGRREAHIFVEFYKPQVFTRIPQVNLSVYTGNPDVISAIYVSVSSNTDDSLQWVAVPPNQPFINITYENNLLDSMKGNFTRESLSNITRLDIAIWAKEGAVGNLTFIIKGLKISTKEPLHFETISNYNMIEPDVWEFYLNNTSSSQRIVFSQAFSSNWAAYVYSLSTGELLEVIPATQFYNQMFNSFKIEAQSNVKVVLKNRLNDALDLQNHLLILLGVTGFTVVAFVELRKRRLARSKQLKLSKATSRNILK